MTSPSSPPPESDSVVESEIDVERVRRTSRGVLVVLFLFVIVLAAGLTIANWPEDTQEVTQVPDSQTPTVVRTEGEAPAIEFKDVTSGLGIDFQHINAAEGEKLLPETMGSGALFFLRSRFFKSQPNLLILFGFVPGIILDMIRTATGAM